MRGVVGRQKKYVEVEVRVATDGTTTPLAVIWEDGTLFRIDEVLDCRRARSRRTDATGTRYAVRLGSVDTYLWCDGSRWFVEEKVVSLPEGQLG